MNTILPREYFADGESLRDNGDMLAEVIRSRLSHHPEGVTVDFSNFPPSISYLDQAVAGLTDEELKLITVKGGALTQENLIKVLEYQGRIK